MAYGLLFVFVTDGSEKGVKQTNFEKDLDKNFADLGLGKFRIGS